MSLIRFLLYGILIYFVLKIFRVFVYVIRTGASTVHRPAEHKRQEDMVHDEICDTYIPRDEALLMVKDGREHFFCSEECRRLFLSGKTRPSNGPMKTLP